MKRLHGKSLSRNSGGAACLAPLSIQETLSLFAR